MRLFGIAGTRNSGKTTLLTGVVRVLTARGLKVATIKLAGRDPAPPFAGMDRMLAAGGHEAALLTPGGWTLTGADRDGSTGAPTALAARFGPVDLVLVEGSRSPGYPRIEVWRPATGRAPLWPGDPDVVAVATDGTIPPPSPPVLDLNDVEAIARVVLAAAVTLR